jgi:beta-mannanase
MPLVIGLLATAAEPAAAHHAPTPTPNPSGPIAVGYYRNVFPNDLSGLSEYEAASGQRPAIVHWYALWGGWKSAFSATDLEIVAAHAAIPLISWEPWAGAPADPAWSLSAAILSGAHDAYIDSWARGLAAYGRPVLLRFAHEMHDQPAYPWAVGTNGNTAADYVAAWQHVRAIFARYSTGNVQWIWNPNTLGDAPAAAYAPIYKSLYPGDDAVDWVGLDVYNTGPGLDWGAPYWRSFSQVLAAPYAALTSVSSKPVLLPEVGSAEQGGSKAAWITSALGSELAAFPRVRALVWFDMNKEQPWQLHSSASALEAWQTAVSNPRFAAAGFWP